jgi:hypothetical protein
MQYKLEARIKNDVRKLIFESIWDAYVGADLLIKKHEGWPEKIYFGGIEVAGEAELSDFSRRLTRAMSGGGNHTSRLDTLRKKILKETQNRIMPK